MLVEGKNAVAECLGGNASVEKILVLKNAGDQNLVNKIKASGVQYQFVEKAALDRISKSKNHQGFIAFVTDYKYFDIDEIIELGYEHGKQPIILILDGVEDPHNLGNILRTAECMGVCGVLIPKNRSATVTETVMRVSAGAAGHVRVCRVTNINQEIEKLKSKGFWIYAAEKGGMTPAQTNLNGPIAIIMGGENSGVRHLTRTIADGVLTLPMYGKITSLNVASATAMILYEVVRQRNHK